MGSRLDVQLIEQPQNCPLFFVVVVVLLFFFFFVAAKVYLPLDQYTAVATIVMIYAVAANDSAASGLQLALLPAIEALCSVRKVQDLKITQTWAITSY